MKARFRFSKFVVLTAILLAACALPMLPLKTADAASGTISATNQYVMIAGTYGSTTISWSASGCDTVQVYVNSDNNNDVLYSHGGSSGSGTPTWIERGRSHVFKLYAGTDRAELLDTITVIGVGSSDGTVGAREQYVAIPDNQSLGTAELTWGVNGYGTGQVYVQMNNNAEQLWAQAATGCGTATWIQKGNTYTFRLYANTGHSTLLDTVTVYGISATPVESTIFDDDGDGEMSLGDRYEHLYPTKFWTHGTITQAHIDMVLSGLDNDAGFDYNNDGEVQDNEFEDAALHYCGYVFDLSCESVTALSVTAYFYDENSNGYITAGDYYRYYYSNGDLGKGRVKQELLDAVTAAGYDYNNLITAAEIRNYLNAKTVHTWTTYLYGALLFPSKDIYSMVTDYNGDDCVSLGEKYVHYHYSGTTVTSVDRGYISQAEINMVVNGGFDYNSDGKVQDYEYEDAAYYYTGDTWKCKIMPKIIDTREYFPTTLGTYWEYEHWQYPSRLTWMHIIPGKTPTSNPDMYYSKNHADTYFSNGSYTFGRLGFNWTATELYGSSTSSYTNYYDSDADTVFYQGDPSLGPYTGKIVHEAWYTQKQAGTIPYVIFPVNLDVDNQVYSFVQDYYQYSYSWPGGARTSNYMDSNWIIKYEWFYIKTDFGYEGPAMHLMADEPAFDIYEDWYFVKDHGVVRIEQYNTEYGRSGDDQNPGAFGIPGNSNLLTVQTSAIKMLIKD